MNSIFGSFGGGLGLLGALPAPFPPFLNAPPPELDLDKLQQLEPESTQTFPEEVIDENSLVSQILQLPPEVLLLIADHLDLPSIICFALSCRSTFAVCHPPPRYLKLGSESKRELLLTLERDPFGRGFYYCQRCNILHRFDPATCGPRSEVEEYNSQGCVFAKRDRFSPVGNCYNLAYHHARLVMNAHLYGAAHGIPLASLCVDHEEQREATTIHCATAARIMYDELFISRTYSFIVADSDVEAFRRCSGPRDFRICEHTPFFQCSSVYRQHIAELSQRPSDGTDGGFVPCDNVLGACGLCLTDYDITIRRTETADPASSGGRAWAIAIRTYHQLGSCRSPDDWRWARFTEKTRPHLFLPNRPNRRSSAHYPGSVRMQWHEDAGSGLYGHG